MKTPEIREAPVPVRGWWWCDKNMSLDEVIDAARDGWNPQPSDFNGITQHPTVFILSNGQAIVVRRKPEKPS